jgi:hypothetical protein
LHHNNQNFNHTGICTTIIRTLITLEFALKYSKLLAVQRTNQQTLVGLRRPES